MEIIDLSKENTILNRFVREISDVEIQGDMMRFRRNLERIGEGMAFKISERLNYSTVSVKTPLDVTFISEPSDKLVLGTILRASLPLHTGLLNVFDRAENAFIAACRKHSENEHLEVEVSYVSTPSIEGKTLILADPMLATGESMVATYNQLCQKAGKPAHTHIVSVIAAQKGVDYVVNELKGENITLWCAKIDPILNERSYIVPGLGDAGDLAFGAKL